jgi:hypothetical protein
VSVATLEGFDSIFQFVGLGSIELSFIFYFFETTVEPTQLVAKVARFVPCPT